ncbi:hypothetical protein BLX87_22780 [Bacillus sp. VT-16-64]|nr:hypothetical protein BLX87_22780 [Bacillus sp. VT-16-64]
MNAFPTERDIRLTVNLLIEKYGVDHSMLVKFIGPQNFIELNGMLLDLEEGELDVYQLARVIVINKGPYLFAGSNDVVRELRAFLLRQLDDEKLKGLYERNPISGKNIKSPSYMPNALAKKKWVMGGKWARDFIQTLNFPLIFSGIAIPKDHSTDPFQDIEPRKTLPPLVEYQRELKDKMLSVLNKEEDKTRCVVTLPTGGGKTRVAVESFIEWMLPRFSEGKYLLWIAQGEELCEQAISCIVDMWQDREFTEALRIYRYFGGKKLKEENLIGGAVIASRKRNYHIIEYMMSIPEGSSSLVYACTVEHAEFLAIVMNSVGRKSAVITADTPKQIRRIHIDAFKKGEIEFLFNYGVLTTGFDAPKTDHILICRPTSSIILYEQMVGRGLRGINFGGTKQCYIVDFSQNIKRHGKPLAYARFIKDWQVKAVKNFKEVTV